ncbi:uroporphyrinogen-III C-methyltransferase [Luteipulveratus sp. YIM 133132]|uniref:uroporphyrinogen-III C-methyltransferase n=1 Tax=Luteipulveratus flavus TaxID=3031728 RepID=UPI0023AEA9B8|nr:uroporphyrinogen-III C-methyltransferase [Luteipulveratus sp. YIM 133132]MDE9365235.1 uroporphyrinogen-III C-methyltransferase [Luteipulveratus sp. YIM 133132]
MTTYTAELDVEGRRVLLVGEGASLVGEATGLLAAGARLTIAAPAVPATVEDLASRGLLIWTGAGWGLTDLDAADLVVATTSDPALAAACRTARVWLVHRRTASPRRRNGAGRVTLVGGGPGDPGLLTVAGRDALAAADVVVCDRLAPVSALAGLDVEVVDVAKVPRGRSTSQEAINALLVERARSGQHVVRLKGGDGYVFGRGGEEAIACAAAGVEVAVVPGVSSAIAGPALGGIPLTHRGLSQGFSVVSGHVPPDDPASTVDYGALARSGTTLVLLMAVATLPAILEALRDAGLPPTTPAATVADAGLPSQRVVRSTVAHLAETVQANGLGAPAITVVGEVAGLEPLGVRPQAHETPA